MINRYIEIPPFVLLSFVPSQGCEKLPVAVFHRRRNGALFLRADNDDRGPQARQHCLALSAESAIRLAERTA